VMPLCFVSLCSAPSYSCEKEKNDVHILVKSTVLGPSLRCDKFSSAREERPLGGVSNQGKQIDLDCNVLSLLIITISCKHR